MKSIQTKLMILIIVGISFSTLLVGGFGIHRLKCAMDEDCCEIINLTCSEQAKEINTLMGRVEQSVEILYEYTLDTMAGEDEISQGNWNVEEYIDKLAVFGKTVANATDGSVSVYVRFGSDEISTMDGFFWVKNSVNGRFENVEITDLAKYDPDDKEVSWYYLPLEAGRPVWLDPYPHQRLDENVISYIIPMVLNGQAVGVVGMDIDYEYLTEKVSNIHTYDTGHAFLTNEKFEVIYSKHFDDGTKINVFDENMVEADMAEIINQDILYDHEFEGRKRKVAFRQLENGMCLAVTVPLAEINQSFYRLIFQIIVGGGCVIFIFVVATSIIARKIVRPLRQLNSAAREIANGKLDIVLECKSKDEVGMLTESIRQTAKQLKKKIDYINNLAYMDTLTGVKNNTAYLQELSVIKDDIAEGDVQFALFIIDLNGLKKINDTYGHDVGNDFIIAASKIIMDVFGKDRVFRVGGDEFAVILRDIDEKRAGELEEIFEERVSQRQGNLKISVAIGSAVYDEDGDYGYKDVFRRADIKMYERKQAMKQRGESSTVESEILWKPRG